MDGQIRVGPWLVEPRLNIVSRNGTAVRVEPKVMEVLVCLAAHPGEVLSKDELLKAVWPDTFVSDDALTHCISDLRRVLEDDAREPRVIRDDSQTRLPARGTSGAGKQSHNPQPKPCQQPSLGQLQAAFVGCGRGRRLAVWC